MFTHSFYCEHYAREKKKNTTHINIPTVHN